MGRHKREHKNEKRVDDAFIPFHTPCSYPINGTCGVRVGNWMVTYGAKPPSEGMRLDPEVRQSK